MSQSFDRFVLPDRKTGTVVKETIVRGPSVPTSVTAPSQAFNPKAVRRSGDTMTGPLILSESPTHNSSLLQAATREYVETWAASAPVKFLQSVPVMFQQFEHDKGYFPMMTVTDLSGESIGLFDFTHDDLNHTTIRFGQTLAFEVTFI